MVSLSLGRGPNGSNITSHRDARSQVAALEAIACFKHGRS